MNLFTNQIAELAQQRLKKDLEKKRRKAAERRRELGIDTPPDPYAVGLTALAAVKMRRRRQKKTTGASESDASLSAEELAPVSKDPQLSGVQLRMQGEGEDGSGSKVGGSATVRQSSAGGRYDNIDDEENLSEDEEGGAKSRVKRPDGGGGGAEGEGECGGESGDSFDPDEDHEDDNSDGGEEGDDDDEQGPDEEGDQQGNEGNEGQQEDGSGNDSDSLDAMLAGLTHKLRQQSEQPLSINPKAHLEVSTRSNSAGANDSPVRSINRNTSSGGSDTRKLTATYYSSLSPTASASNSNSSRKSQQLGISERDRLHSAFERAEISSAHENFEDLMENFEAENFLNQSSVVQLFRTNTSGELVEGADENRDFPSENPSSRNKSRNVKPKLSTGASSKKIVIPRHLQNTPYFKHYKKHSDAALVESKSSAQFTSSDGGANVKGADNYGNSAKTGSKVPLLARKKQLAEQAASGSVGGGIALGASASAPTLPLDEDLLQFQQNQQK